MTEEDTEEYVIPEGGGVPWRDVSRGSDRPGARDVEITGLDVMALAGNFTWGIVKLHTDAGEYGLGETFIGEEALDVVARLEPLLVGENPLDTRRVVEHLEQLRTHPGSIGRSAFAAVETACLDVKGKLLDVPVYELLGGRFRDEVRVYCDAHAGESLGAAQKRDPRGVYTPESYAETARAVVDEGFTALKFDLDVPTHRAADTAARRLDNEAIEHKANLVAAVRDEVGDVDLGVDLHWNFTVETATRLGRALEPHDLAWIEDPVPPQRTDAHRRVAADLATPVLAGENLTSPQEFLEALRADALDIAAPDVCRTGGLHDLLAVARLCDLFGVPLAPHNVASPVGTVAGAHACAAAPNVVALEYHARDVPWWGDLVTRTGGDGPVIADGTVAVPEGPGLGIEIDDSVAERHLTDGTSLV